MATIRIVLGIFCFALAGGHDLPYSYLLGQHHSQQADLKREISFRQRILNFARAEIGVRELSGNNDGARIEAYLAIVGLKKGNPYCAAFVSFIFAEAELPHPRTAWCPALFPGSRISEQYLPGNVFGIYFPELKRIAHVGFIERMNGDWCQSIEANTNPSGARNGDGVYRRIRHKRTIYRISDWIHRERMLP